MVYEQPPNGSRYPLVGGRETPLCRNPRKLLENAATSTGRVHALFGGVASVIELFYAKHAFARELVGFRANVYSHLTEAGGIKHGDEICTEIQRPQTRFALL